MNDDLNRDAEQLVRSILARTSGSPCTSARDRLVAFADGELSPVDDDLMRMHVGACAHCAALVGALRRSSIDLPALAEIEPDARFVGDVLAATRARRPSTAARLAEWLTGACATLLRRPRIAWEAAYVGTFVLALIFAVPGSPLAGVPEKALDVARVNPVQEMREPAAEIRQGMSRKLDSAWQQSSSGAGAVWDAVKSDVEKIGANLKRGFGTLWAGAASEQDEAEDRKGD
jgi:hypothetical protein